ncbi:hypothetical protein ACJX0J_018880 [Zea mays]
MPYFHHKDFWKAYEAQPNIIQDDLPWEEDWKHKTPCSHLGRDSNLQILCLLASVRLVVVGFSLAGQQASSFFFIKYDIEEFLKYKKKSMLPTGILYTGLTSSPSKLILLVQKLLNVGAKIEKMIFFLTLVD